MKTILQTTLTAALLLATTGAAHAQLSGRPQCDDGVDNDDPEDTTSDYSPIPGQGDPGCDSWNDTSEVNQPSTSNKIKPRLAVLFDVSGSMSWEVDEGESSYTGDGSLDCPGDNNARMPLVKRGTFDAIAAYGELEYSLYRFHQSRRDSFSCPSSYSVNNSMGRWRGATDQVPCTGDFAAADLLVKFGPENSQWILQWMDNATNYTARDYELRPSGYTPIAGSLTTIRTHLLDIRDDDPFNECRPYRVVVVTDGEETCHPQGTTGAANAAGLLLSSEMPVYVIGFSSEDLQDEMDQIASAGGTGDAYLADSPAELSNALADIVDELTLVESCNGEDDDCDGVIDNGFNLGPCDNGQLGACFREGEFVCINASQTACNAPSVNPGSEETHG